MCVEIMRGKGFFSPSLAVYIEKGKKNLTSVIKNLLTKI